MRLTDSGLLLIAGIMACCGLAILIVCSIIWVPAPSALRAVGREHEGATVRVQARVVSARIAGNTTLLTLEETVRRPAVIFAPVEIARGAIIDATGRVASYHGRAELVISQLAVQDEKLKAAANREGKRRIDEKGEEPGR